MPRESKIFENVIMIVSFLTIINIAIVVIENRAANIIVVLCFFSPVFYHVV